MSYYGRFETSPLAQAAGFHASPISQASGDDSTIDNVKFPEFDANYEGGEDSVPRVPLLPYREPGSYWDGITHSYAAMEQEMQEPVRSLTPLVEDDHYLLEEDFCDPESDCKYCRLYGPRLSPRLPKGRFLKLRNCYVKCQVRVQYMIWHIRKRCDPKIRAKLTRWEKEDGLRRL